MVDLVKIRKKAKEKKEEESAASLPAASPAGAEPSDEHTIRAAASERKASPKKEKKQGADPTGVAPRETPSVAVEAASEAPAEAAEKVPAPEPAAVSAAEPRPAATPDPAKATKLDRFKQQAGKLREAADASGARTEAVAAVGADDRLEVLTFGIGAETYAVDIEHIVEIVPLRNVTRVPNADLSVIGILSLRGTIVTLVDVHRRLKHARAATTPESRIVVVEHDGETIGFQVDRVFRVVKMARTEVDPHPVVHTSELDDSIRGVFRQGESLTILLDFDKLLDRRDMPRTGSLEPLATQA